MARLTMYVWLLWAQQLELDLKTKVVGREHRIRQLAHQVDIAVDVGLALEGFRGGQKPLFGDLQNPQHFEEGIVENHVVIHSIALV